MIKLVAFDWNGTILSDRKLINSLIRRRIRAIIK